MLNKLITAVWLTFTVSLLTATYFGLKNIKQWQTKWLEDNPISPYQSLPHIVLNADVYLVISFLVMFVGISLWLFGFLRKQDETPTDKSK